MSFIRTTVANLSDAPLVLTCRYCLDEQRESAAFHISTLQKAKQRGCQLCAAIVAAIEHLCSQTGHPVPRKALIWNAEAGTILLDVNTDHHLLLQLCVREENLETLPLGLDWPSIDMHSCYTGSDKALLWARDALEYCRTNHPLCTQLATAPRQSPPLVVRIEHAPLGEDNLQIRLVDYTPDQGEYACLSHCWGTAGPLKTTAATKKAFEACIPWSALPKSFQETIRFTFNAGISDIWIDSLCIVQDDSNDKVRQIPLMGEIYEGAVLTLAVTRSRDPSEGCFSTIKPRYSGYVVTLPSGSTLPPLVVREAFAHDYSQHGYKAPDRDKVPLLFRGWVFQERLLSRRVLHVTAEELGWECLTSRRCECRCDPHPVPGFKEDVSQALTLGDPDALYPRWRALLEQYTTMDLTYHDDRLPAIEGLARKFQQRLGEGYVHDVWDRHLHESLSWMVLRPPHRTEKPAAPS
ncbi:heterokaryon incompatibility protein-domain-containing protein [Daedaleopsis nitida]|nr:heterokaryon incompatibility protein-domain-containing protein [Daedaleopsis nitida]